MDAEDLDLFARSLRHAAASAADLPPDASGTALDAALADLGWHEALDDYPRESISTLFSIQGETNTTSSALHRLVAWAATGSTSAPGAVLPALGGSEPPGRASSPSGGEGGGSIEVDGLVNQALVAAPDARVTVVFTWADGRVGAVEVPVALLDLSPVHGLDPDAALVRVTGSLPPDGKRFDSANAPLNDRNASDTPFPLLERSAAESKGWPEAVRLGRLAVAHELVGASRAVLGQAREHALERIQFGQPIARFQAVRHKLAEVLIAVETAEALLDAAWLDGTDVTAAMAAAAAGRAARLAAKHGQQVLAGIGFTTEHGLHRWIRRILVLDEVLGSARVLTHDLGARLLETRHLPPLLPLWCSDAPLRSR